MIHLLVMNKTKFLHLLEKETRDTPWADLPTGAKSEYVHFYKVPRRWDCFLEWQTDKGFFRAFLAPMAGKPMLSLERIEEGLPTHREVWTLDIEQLPEEGMDIDTDTNLTKLTRAEQEQLKARFARIAAKLKGSGSR